MDESLSKIEEPLNKLSEEEIISVAIINKRGRIEAHISKNQAKYRIFFGGIPKNCRISTIYQYFRMYGKIVSFKLYKWKRYLSNYGSTVRHRGCGVVQFESSSSVDALLGEIDYNPCYTHEFSLENDEVEKARNQALMKKGKSNTIFKGNGLADHDNSSDEFESSKPHAK
jgi:hypothetical protein